MKIYFTCLLLLIAQLFVSGQSFNIEIQNIEYACIYNMQKLDSGYVLHCRVGIFNKSNKDILIPNYRSFYSLSDQVLVQKMGVLYRGIKDGGAGREDGDNLSPLDVRMLRARDSTEYNLVMYSVVDPAAIKQKIMNIDFIFSEELNENDYKSARKFLVDGKEYKPEKDILLIPFQKFKDKAVHLTLDFTFPFK